MKHAFGKRVCSFAGWGMRTAFVPEEEDPPPAQVSCSERFGEGLEDRQRVIILRRHVDQVIMHEHRTSAL